MVEPRRKPGLHTEERILERERMPQTKAMRQVEEIPSSQLERQHLTLDPGDEVTFGDKGHVVGCLLVTNLFAMD